MNGFTRLSGLTVPGSRYFFKVSSTPDFDNKILSTVESGFEAQNLLKFCPEYCNVVVVVMYGTGMLLLLVEQGSMKVSL